METFGLYDNSTQVLQELYVVLTQKLSKLDIITVEPSLIFEGIAIKRTYKISFFLKAFSFIKIQSNTL